MRGAVLMQTSGFATLATCWRRWRSLSDPADHVRLRARHARRIQYGQSPVCRTMRPVLDRSRWSTTPATRLDEFEFIVDRSIKQAITTQAPVALILSPLLTGGKVFDK